MPGYRPVNIGFQNSMSAPNPAAAEPDPSMEDILASIRRILSEDEADGGATPATDAAETPRPGREAAQAPRPATPVAEVFALDRSMMVDAREATESLATPSSQPGSPARAAAPPAAREPAPASEPAMNLNAFAISDAEIEPEATLPPTGHSSRPDAGGAAGAAQAGEEQQAGGGQAGAGPARAPVPPSPPAASSASSQPHRLAQPHRLDSSMQDATAGDPASAPSATMNGNDTARPGTGHSGLMAPETVSAASGSVGSLLRKIAADRSAMISKSGVTIEDAIREEMRPMLKTWLDTHLPAIVERLVRTEIERVVNNAID